MLLEGTSSTGLAAMSAAQMDTLEGYAIALLIGYLAHVLFVTGLFIRRGHPSWLGLAFGLLPLIGLAVALLVGDTSRLRQQEREGLHLVHAAQSSTDRSRYVIRVALLVGIGVVVLLFLGRETHRLDLTEGQRYTLDPVSQRLLSEISRYETVLRVRYYYSPADVRPQRFATLPREMRELLDEYKRFGGERFEFHLIEVPQLGYEPGEEPDEVLDGPGFLDVQIEDDDDEAEEGEEAEPDRTEQRQLQILRELRDLGIQPIHDEIVEGGRTEQLRFYSALHISYGPAGEEVLDDITVSRQRAAAGQRAVDIANWKLTHTIVMLMDRSINRTHPFKIRAFGYDGSVRLADHAGFQSVGDELHGNDGVRYRLVEIDAQERRIVVEPLDGGEPVELLQMPSFRHRIGLLEGHNEDHGSGFAIHELWEDYGFEIVHVDTQGGKEPIPDDIDVLVITSSAEAISELTQYQLDQFMMKGGRILYTYSAFDLPAERTRVAPFRHTDPTWRRFAESYGVNLGVSFVFDNICYRIAADEIFWPLAIHLRPENLSNHPLRAGIVAGESVEERRLRRLWIYGVPVTQRRSYWEDDDGVKIPEMRYREALRSSDSSWLQDVNYDILRDPFGVGTASQPGSNPHLQRLLVGDRTANESFPLAASVEGRIPSAFDNKPAQRSDGSDDFDGESQEDAANDSEAAQGAHEHYDRALAESRMMVFGTGMIYPHAQPFFNLDEFMENALLYLIPEGEALLGLKAKTTAYTPIWETGHRNWHTAMVTLMVPIGLLIVAVLVMLAERAEQMFFRARQQARRRGTAATSPFGKRELARRQLAGGGMLGLGILLVLMGALGWFSDPRSSVLWLLAFVLALPLCGYGLEQLGGGRRDDDDEQDAATGFSFSLVPLAFAFAIVGLGMLLLLFTVEQFKQFDGVMIGMLATAWSIAVVVFGTAIALQQREQHDRNAVPVEVLLDEQTAPVDAAEESAEDTGQANDNDDDANGSAITT